MGFVEDLENKVSDYLSGSYEVSETKSIPSVEQVSFGKKAKKMDLCAYCIDLRKSTDLLTSHQKQTCGKIHKAFLTVAASVVLKYGGEIRSFNGDGLLAFWPANLKSQIQDAVRCAMVTKWLLDVKLSKYFENYEKIDFGIGIDWSEVFIIKTGISRNTNNNDLVFIGKCVNYATEIANQAHGSYHVEISPDIYSNLGDSLLYGISNGNKVNMWKDGVVNWKDEKHDSKITAWYIPL